MNNSTITIPLSKTGKHAGKYEAIVSIEDVELTKFNWSVNHTRKVIYAYRQEFNGTNRITIHLHREVMKQMLGYPIPDGMEVDHIDGDGLNNTRDNLRLASRGQNAANQKHIKSKVGLKGVDKRGNRYRAMITFQNKTYHLGYFDTPELAHEAYCKKAKELHGEFANTGE